MTFEQFHNGLRLLFGLEADQLSFLTDAQKDNFYSNPHMFFIRADDATARQLWDVMYPKPKEPAAGEAAKDAGGAKVIDLDAFRKAVDALPRLPEQRPYRYWTPRQTYFEYDTGRVYPPPAPNTAADVPRRTYLVN